METEFRRKAPRRPFDGHIGILSRGQVIITRCTQLGEGGALISAIGDLTQVQKEQSLVITLFLPGIGGVVASACCVYTTEQNNMGLQFQSIEVSSKKRIREFVSRRKVTGGN